jgi:hypothetical protein
VWFQIFLALYFNSALETLIQFEFSCRCQHPDENVRLFLIPMTRRLLIVAILIVTIITIVEHQSIHHYVIRFCTACCLAVLKTKKLMSYNHHTDALQCLLFANASDLDRLKVDAARMHSSPPNLSCSYHSLQLVVIALEGIACWVDTRLLCNGVIRVHVWFATTLESTGR